MPSKALITPSVVTWARERAGLQPEDLAKKVLSRPDAEKALAWESGEELPTFRQAQKIADATHIPFGFLYLAEPPEEKVELPDFRRKAQTKRYQMSIHLRDIIRQSLGKQDWYREYLISNDYDPLAFVGAFKPSDPVDAVVNSMRTELKLPLDAYEQVRTMGEYLTQLSQKAEQIGIMVLRSGYVSSNTHRILDAEEFRGFASVDEYAPLIFINSTDHDAAKVFTFFHELAHIWIGESGISDLESTGKGEHDIERYCNEVAAEILVPRAALQKAWDPFADPLKQSQELGRRFKVSTLVIARRAFELRHIDRAEHDRIFAIERANYQKASKKKDDGQSGGNYYRTMAAKNGLFFSQAVLNALHEGNLTHRAAKDLLDVSVPKLNDYASEIEKALIKLSK